LKILRTETHERYSHHIRVSRKGGGGYDWSEQLSRDKDYALFKTLHHALVRRLSFNNSFDRIILERLVSIEVSKTGASNNEQNGIVEDIANECNKVLQNPTVRWFLQHQYRLVYDEPLKNAVHTTICFEKEENYYYLQVCREITYLDELKVEHILGVWEQVNSPDNNGLDNVGLVHFAIYCLKSHDIRWIGN